MRLNDIRHEMAKIPKDYPIEGHQRADELLVETVRILIRPLDITQATARRQTEQILGHYVSIKKLYGM
jgi:hypothetical protein